METTILFAAQEAKERADKFNEIRLEKHREELKQNWEELKQKILDTIEIGGYEYYFVGSLLESDVDFLKKNGYKLVKFNDSSEECYTICWS